MLGGVIAIAVGVLFAGLSWGSMWPWGPFVAWVAPQQLLTQWVVGCLLVGGVLLVGGARAAGAALVGSSVGSIVAYLLRVVGLYGGDHLETLVHVTVVLGSVGLVVFGLRGLRRRARAPLGRYPVALALALATVVVGTLMIIRIYAEATPYCSPHSCFRGFEEPWLQVLLSFNVGFLALLFLLHAWQATRSSGKHEQEDGTLSDEWGRFDPSSRSGRDAIPPVRTLEDDRRAGSSWKFRRAAGGTGTLDDCQHLLS